MLTSWTDTYARLKSPLTNDVIIMVLAIVILNTLDAFLTLLYVGFLGATEVNIIMDWAIRQSHTFFVLTKLLVESVCALSLAFITTEPRVRKIAKIVLVVLFVVYLLTVICPFLLVVILY